MPEIARARTNVPIFLPEMFKRDIKICEEAFLRKGICQALPVSMSNQTDIRPICVQFRLKSREGWMNKS